MKRDEKGLIRHQNANVRVILGSYWDYGKEMETTIVYGGYIGIMENKMETALRAWTTDS